jgi:uncharacterized protein YdeI (YjbR/CyaY-like superfamily)
VDDPTFFALPLQFRSWLEDNHDRAPELVVGFYKRGSGKPSMTWPESVDEALCFGWIDGIRRGRDEESYTIRFTPRKPTSHWSRVNVKRVGELTEVGLMRAPGLAAFSRRREHNTAQAAYEGNWRALDAETEGKLRAHASAWEFFTSQAPSYRRSASHWVMSAKRPKTREKRLAALIDDSQDQRRIGLLRRPGE